MTKRRLHGEPRQFWTGAEDALIRRLYPDMRAEALLAQLPGRTLVSIYARARKFKLKKSAAFHGSPASGRTDGTRGASSRFQPGHTSWNKGRRFRAGGASVQHQFRKGHRPHNHTPVGTRRQTSGDRYWKEKVAEPNVWRFVHRITWEAAHGPVPRGKVLVFKDGNRDHLTLDNLELIDRQDVMRRNSIHNFPAPIPQLVQLRGALVRKLNRRASREASREEQAQ